MGFLFGVPLLGGCAKPKVEFPTGMASIVGFEQEIKRIRADPIAFIRESSEESAKLTHYTMHFQRQERLGGLIKSLQRIENIHAEFRNTPFSVRFTWLDDDSEYQQCFYVEGKNKNKVRLLPRKGLFGTRPTADDYPPHFAVLFNKTRNPITDFGPRRMLERTLDRIAKAIPHGGVKIVPRDAAEIGPYKEMCFHLELHYPKGDEYDCKLQDLYIHARTRLPVGTYLWITEKDERTADTLDAMYVYANLNPDALITDQTFEIDEKGIDAIKKAATQRTLRHDTNGNASAAMADRQDEAPAQQQ